MYGRPATTIKRLLRFIEESDVEDSSSELSAYPTDEESSGDSVFCSDEQPSCSGPSHGDFMLSSHPTSHPPLTRPHKQWKSSFDQGTAYLQTLQKVHQLDVQTL